MIATEISPDQAPSIENVLQAIRSYAIQSAIFTAHFWKNWCRKHQIPFEFPWPKRFLLELAAILEVGRWQRAGNLPQLLQDLPPWEHLFDHLVCNLEHFLSNDEPSPLSLRLFRVWYLEAVWNHHALPQVPIQLKAIDTDQLIDELANLLWNHRHLARLPGETHVN